MFSSQLIAFWLYSIVLVIIWWIFLVAKIHILKFRNYNPVVIPVTKLLALVLIILSCIGYYIVFTIKGESTGQPRTIQDTTVSDGY